MEDTELVDRIYECAFRPELWPGVLDRLAVIGGAVGGTLFTVESTGILNVSASDIMIGAITAFANSDAWKTSQRLTTVLQMRHAGFVTETPEIKQALALDPLYHDILHPQGLGWASGTAVAMPTGDTLCVTLERTMAAGPTDPETLGRLDQFRPHIVRSVFLAARQHLARAQTTSDTLALIGLPTLVVDQLGRVLATNALVDALEEHIVWGAADRFNLVDRSANALLQQALATLDVSDKAPSRSFVIRDADLRPALVAHVLPVRRSARDLFMRSIAVLVLTPVAMPQAPPAELVQSLFDLTPAEARVARSIATGETVDDIAQRSGVSHHTVRTQLRSVLNKTGCHRQTEVAVLLGGISMPIL